MALTLKVLDAGTSQLIEIGTATFYGNEGSKDIKVQVIDIDSGAPYYIQLPGTVNFIFPASPAGVTIAGVVQANRSLVMTTIPGTTLPFLTTGAIVLVITEPGGVSQALANGAIRKLSAIQGTGSLPAGMGSDYEVKATASDTVPGYLDEELEAGVGIQIQEIGGSGDTRLKISAVATPVEQPQLVMATDATFGWDLSNSQLIFTAPILIDIPGSSIVNTIDNTISSPVIFTANGQVAYVDINPTASQTIPILVVAEVNYIVQANRYIIAKRESDEVTIYDFLL